ncbi:MAG TPA: AraC family transcriptional regulator [Candidatus Anaerobutyricum avicola]|nr:AraC family transcriptional regulator [Candidatus Anaerobutyricum avicola]
MEVAENYRIDANFRWLGSEIKANEELCLTVCGIERCTPDKFFGPSVREDYHVHFILHGKGTLEIGGKSYKLQRGQIFVIPPDVETYYYSDPEDPWHYTWVSFGGTREGYFLEKAGITAENPVRDTYIEPERFLELTEKILNHHELTVANELLRTSLLYEIIALLVESQNQQKSKEGEEEVYDYSPDVYVNTAIEYIGEHYPHTKVSEIASYIGISRYYLTHIFKEKLHVSPQEFLLNYRMEQANRLLRTTGLSVQAVSEKVGYENPLTFSKTFKNKFGLSPKKYREKMKREEQEHHIK